MGAVAFAFRGRFIRRWRSWIGIGVLLGIGFGIALATLASARHTASSYPRIVDAARAPDATTNYTEQTDDVEPRLAGLQGVESFRSAVGFTGFIEGVDRAFSRVLMAPWGDYFPIEHPHLRDGRLPDPSTRGEIFVNAYLADHAKLSVGDEVVISVLVDDFAVVHTERLTITGIGTTPRELVADETAGFGLVVFSSVIAREFGADAAYRLTSFDLAPGFDAERDLYPQLRDRDLELVDTLAEDIERVQTAIRPLLALLVTFGLVLLVATAVAMAQVVARGASVWSTDDRRLQVLGLTPRRVLSVRVAGAMVTAAAAVLTAVALMAAASPLAPVGPLHGSDPEAGVRLDLVVVAAGSAFILVVALAASARGGVRTENMSGTTDGRPLSATALSTSPSAMAGLNFANPSSGPNRGRAWSSIALSVAAVATTAGVVTLGSSAKTLVDEPHRYGFDWDLIVLNAFSDQDPQLLRSMFADDPQVSAATGFTTNLYALNESVVVSGFALTDIKGALKPTLIAGREVQAADEVALGRDTLADIDASIGDQITIEELNVNGVLTPPATVRIVGVVTFPSVSQTGNDQPRLGRGMLFTSEARDRLGAEPNAPEWTAIRLADGVRTDQFIAGHPEGIPNPLDAPTEWFTSAAPAELLELESVLGLLAGAAAITFVMMFLIVLYALLSQTRLHRRDLAVLHAMGFTRRQLAAVVPWQSLPLAIASIFIGIPLGILLARQQYAAFARRLGVIDAPSTPALLIISVVLGVLLALGISVAVAMSMARRTQPAIMLRSQ
jgi:hypothetical protein